MPHIEDVIAAVAIIVAAPMLAPGAVFCIRVPDLFHLLLYHIGCLLAFRVPDCG